jgi:Fic family protein
MPKFIHHDLRLLNPSFESPLIDVLTELDHLRRLRIEGNTPPPVFFQLKQIFHMLESLGSARIEGNHTTLADYVESHLQHGERTTDQLREIQNIERAMNYVDEIVQPGSEITEHFIRELHHLAVSDLEREGDRTPGAYRTVQVEIAQAVHLPPDPINVPGYMRELVDFINRRDAQKYDLMKVALAHHRFGWVHPFRNGNGRVVRLMTYALLVKYGFNVTTGGGQGGRILNPTAVFCNNRGRYYETLARADAGTHQSLEDWCIYVLDGMLEELRKVDRLADFGYLRERVLDPAIGFAKARQLITKEEATVLEFAINSETKTIRAGDLATLFPDLNTNQRTYKIKRLLENGMLQPVVPKARQYTVGFANSYLVRGVIAALTDEGFIPQLLARG